MVLLETAWAPVWAYVVQYVTLYKAIPIVFLEMDPSTESPFSLQLYLATCSTRNGIF